MARVVRAEDAGGRDGNVDTRRVAGVLDDRVQAHAARAWHPAGAGLVMAQAGQLPPRLATIRSLEKGRVLCARVHRVRVCQRRLQVPDAFELPRFGRTVIPQVITHLTVVFELIAHRLQVFPASLDLLDHLPEPATRLGCVDAVGVSRVTP